MFFAFPFLVIVLCSLLCYWLCGKLISILSNKKIIALPNHRSSHVNPTPVGGGVAILFSFFIGTIPFILYYSDSVYTPLLFAFALSALTLISFIDDIKEVSIIIRLCSHVIAAIIGSYVALQNGSIFPAYIPFWLEFFIIVLFIVTFINLFNFMDGIDGMTGMETLFITISLSIGFYITEVQSSYIYILMLLAGCTLAFLRYNWHPAKLFIGDAGSISIGFLLGTLLCIWAAKGYWVQAIILPMYYFFDAGVVLLLRVIRREKFWLPHTKHFFQIAVRHGFSHSEVVLKVLRHNILLTLLSLISLFFKNKGMLNLEYLCLGLAVLNNICLINSMKKNVNKV